jgi:tungstate transport system substrate-binding protein
MTRFALLFVTAIPVCVGFIGCSGSSINSSSPNLRGTKVKCAVIGGMMDTGLWQGVTERFKNETGITVEVVAAGPKHIISGPFRRGEADLITMHASDTIINLVADGYGINPQPWARNDQLLVGPKSDPAKIKGMTDAVAALKRIIETKSKLLVHQSLGTNEVLHDLLAEGDLALDPDATISLPIDRHRQLLERAAKEQAYTIVGRIPFLNGKIRNDGLEIMVKGDSRMRRPYLVVARVPKKPPTREELAAQKLADFLRQAETQAWVAEYGKGTYDDQPLFFPVTVTSDAAASPR